MRTESLARALPTIARIISQKMNVQVVFGDQAATDCESTIYLPQLPPLEASRTDIDLYSCYLTHESSHMYWTDPIDEQSAKDPLLKSMWNILEDVRVEQLARENLPPGDRILRRGVQILVDRGADGKSGFAASSESDSNADVLQGYMLFRLRNDVLQQSPVSALLESTEKIFLDRFPVGMRTRLEALMFEVRNCVNADQVLGLAKRIKQMIEEESEPPPPEENDSGEQQERSGQTDQHQDSQAQQGADSTQGASDADEARKRAALKELLCMQDDQISPSLGEILGEAVNESSEAILRNAKTPAMPDVLPLDLNVCAVDTASIHAAINAIRTSALRWMSSAVETQESLSYAGNCIDHSQLHRAPFGGPVFKNREEETDLNVAVSILVDASGSMAGSKIVMAAHASVGAMLALKGPGFQSQVAVFPVRHSSLSFEGIGLAKNWNDSTERFAARAASLTASGSTPMAEAILFALLELEGRDESNRIILVVSDGEPNDEEQTQAVIAEAQRRGIHTVCCGIGHDPSGVFGKRYSAHLDSISELSGAMVGLIRSTFAMQ